MMKSIYIILSLFSFHCISFGQDTTKKIAKNPYQFAFKAGGYYENFWRNRYINPTLYSPDENFQAHQYDRFSKIPTGGYHAGFLITHEIIKNNWYLTSGLLFCYRKNILEINQDSAVKYGSFCDIKKYDYSYNNIEIPIMILYKTKQINLYLGVNLPILSFYKANYTYVDIQPWNSYQKTIKGFCIPVCGIPSLFPSYDIQWSPWEVTKTPASPKVNYDMPLILATFQISYDVKIKNISFSPFLGIDIGTKKIFYLQGGIIVPINKYISPLK
jgi:hypothetical protein